MKDLALCQIKKHIRSPTGETGDGNTCAGRTSLHDRHGFACRITNRLRCLKQLMPYRNETLFCQTPRGVCSAGDQTVRVPFLNHISRPKPYAKPVSPGDERHDAINASDDSFLLMLGHRLVWVETNRYRSLVLLDSRSNRSLLWHPDHPQWARCRLLVADW